MIQNDKPQTIRYSDYQVLLYPIESENTLFSYVEPFKPIFTEGEGGDGTEGGGSVEEQGTGYVYPVTLERIIYSSDATSSVLSGTIADLETSKRNVGVYGDSKNIELKLTPMVGWGITVSVKGDGRHYSANASHNEIITTAPTFTCIFKGYITSITRQVGPNGFFYKFEARDIKHRLTYQTIKKTYNGTYKSAGVPIIGEDRLLSSTAEFDSPYISGNLTVYQILKDILSYATKTTSITNTENPVYDDFVGFNINSFDTSDSYLMEFVPPSISFDNITILEAIYRLINTAGPYRISVDYSPHGADKIYFFSLNNYHERCGNEVVLRYGNGINGFHEVNVISDTTYRKIYDACSIMKSYTGEIEWYSGHFYIYKGLTENKIKESAEFGDGKKTYTRNVLSCRNWDGYHYYFGLNTIPYGESNSDSMVIVGTPLYPAWDPNSGYKPYQRSFFTFIDDMDKAAQELPASGGSKPEICLTLNNGITENDVKFVKHRNFLDTIGKDRLKNAVGLSYVAYVPYDICWACNGTGAVNEDCSEDTRYSAIFGTTRDADGNLTYDKDSYGLLTPFNYDFIPATYSNKSEDMQIYLGDGYLVPRNHPLPWKNTCPVCRGTGLEPWYKMGTILNSLVDISPSQVKIGELTDDRVNSAGKDVNNGSLVMDKTYSQITEDMSYKYPVSIQVESPTAYPSYVTALEEDKNTWVKHPLADVNQVAFHDSNTSEAINMNAKVFQNGNDDSTRADDEESRYIQALYYSQIQDASGYQIDYDRSLVIFNSAMFIPYKAPMKTIKEVMSKNKIKAPYYDKKQKCFVYAEKGDMNGVGQDVGSYWRPARAWITCYFKRDRLEDFLKKKDNAIVHKLLQRTQIGVNGTIDFDVYRVSPRIESNRYCAEIMKVSLENDLEVEEFKIRPIARGIFCDDFKWQIHPWDFKKLPVPGSTNDGGNLDFIVPTDYSDMWKDGGVYSACVNNRYYFPCGKLMKFEQLKEIELRTLVNNGKIDVSDMLRTDVAGKIIAWAHKDDRLKLFERSCAELERRNNVQISGTVVIRGETPHFTGGFGWVTLLDGMTATVVKIEMTFGENYLMNLEVGTEEMRVGQKKESEKDYDRLIQDAITELNTRTKSFGINQFESNRCDTSDNVTVMGPIQYGGGVTF